jgi:hypothetical protein
MKRRIIWVLALIGCGLALLGARSCEVWAQTDASEYEAGASASATLYNDTSKTVFLPGCGTFNFEKLIDGEWVDQGPDIVCVWEGVVRPVAAGATVETGFVPAEEGTYRLRFAIGHGCLADQPASQAECRHWEDVYTNAYVVTAPPGSCEYYGRSLEVGETTYDFDRCNRCFCGEGGELGCTKRACVCDVEAEWFRDYRYEPEQCAVIRYMCPPNQFPFSNACGCGCQQAPWCEEYFDCEPPTDCSFEQTHCPYSTFGL